MDMNPLTALTAEELIAWNDATAERWFSFLAATPSLLETPCDIHDADTVGKFLQHIAAAELRHAERLSGSPISDYGSVTYATVADPQATHTRTIALLRSLLADPTIDWAAEMEFTTLTAGRRRCSRRAILFHAMLHGIRHYAQLATLVRHAGFTPNIPGDYLLMA